MIFKFCEVCCTNISLGGLSAIAGDRFGHRAPCDELRTCIRTEKTPGSRKLREILNKFNMFDAARDPSWTAQHTANVIAAVAEGYPFPAMLDAAPPTSAEGRETEATLLATAIEQRWTVTELQRRLSLCESHHRPPRLPPPSVWAWALRPIAHALGVRDGWRGLADGVAKWALAAPGAAVRATRRAVARLVS